MEPPYGRTDLPAPLSTLIAVVGGMRQVAGEHDEVGLPLKSVHQGNGVLQRHVRLRVWRTLKPPMRVGELQEVEVVRAVRLLARRGATGDSHQTRAKDDAAQTESEQLQEITSIWW